MPEMSTFALFALSSLAVLALPGPTMLYVVARTLEHGRAAGLRTVVGVQVGTLIHVVLAICGLSAVLASSHAAMLAVQLAGATYLVWLGVGRLRAADGDACAAGTATAAGAGGVFWQSVLVDALNPKTAVFFLAFLPQFVDPSRGAVAPQVAALGLCFVALAAISDGTCAVAAAALRGRLLAGRASRRRMDRATGVLLVGLGVAALLAG